MALFNLFHHGLEQIFTWSLRSHPIRSHRFALAIILVSGCATILSAQQPILRVDHRAVTEQSAIIKSSSYEDLFWVCSDSDGEAYLFPLTATGQMIVPDWQRKRYAGEKIHDYPGVRITTAHLNDWEALTVLRDTLVIADVGNNGNARRDLGIYLVPEPNPRAVYETRPLAWYPVRYEDQKNYPAEEWEFDCEAIFAYKGKLYFLTKHRSDRHIIRPAPSTKLYRMDTRHTNRSNILKFISRKDDLGGWVTDASMAQDGSAMVLLAQNPLATMIWYFPSPKRGDDFLAQPPRTYTLAKAGQAEGVCFKDSKTLIVTNEQGDWFEIPLSAFKP